MKRYLKMALAVALAAALMAGAGCLKSANTGTETQTTQSYNLSGMSTDINALKTWKDAANSRLTTIEAVIAGGSSGATKAEMQAVQSDIASIRAQVNAIQPTDISGVTAQVSTIQGKITAVETTLVAYGADIQTLKTDYAALKTAFDVLVASVTAQEAEIAALKIRVAALETPPTTTTPPTTPPITAADAVLVSVSSLPTEMAYPTADTDTTYFLTIAYTNTANKQFTNVKFKLTLYGTVTSFTSVTSTSVSPTTPLWVGVGGSTSYYYLQTLTGITIPANGSGELIISLKIKCAGTGILFPLVQIS